MIQKVSALTAGMLSFFIATQGISENPIERTVSFQVDPDCVQEFWKNSPNLEKYLAHGKQVLIRRNGVAVAIQYTLLILNTDDKARRELIRSSPSYLR
jgi:hypothetical protein